MTTSEWLSLVLVLITCVYVVMTGKLAQQSERTANSSLEAAEASKEAAIAAKRSANVAEAQLGVSFDIIPNRWVNGKVWFTVIPSVNVILQSADLKVWILRDETAEEGSFSQATLQPPVDSDSEPLPRFTHAGQPFSLEWPSPVIHRDDYGMFGYMMFKYSLTEEGPTRSRSEYFETDEGTIRNTIQKRRLLRTSKNPST